MRILSVHAHFDDFEYVAGGTFEQWRRKGLPNFRSRILVCTDGKAGHHFRTREETGSMRLREQAESARLGGHEFETLRLPNGSVPREACLQGGDPQVLAALWKAIREFEPDYLFCPPWPSDPLAGVHVDHWSVAEAVRKVAYMINVPHAFTPEYPADETISRPCKVPVILNVYDGYMAGANAFDLAVDVEEAFGKVCEMTYCHQSQFAEWLPWVDRHGIRKPESLEDFSAAMRQRYLARNREMEIKSGRLCEAFTVTAWGAIPTVAQLLKDFPALDASVSHLQRLCARLDRWRGQPEISEN